MKRRGFFGLMGGALVSGPSMAKQAANMSLDQLSVGSGFGNAVKVSGSILGSGYGETIPTGDYDPAGWAKRELAEHLSRSASELARDRLETQVHQLDPDIAAMASIALGAKIRWQRDRNFERNRISQKGWLEREIQQAIKRAIS